MQVVILEGLGGVLGGIRGKRSSVRYGGDVAHPVQGIGKVLEGGGRYLRSGVEAVQALAGIVGILGLGVVGVGDGGNLA